MSTIPPPAATRVLRAEDGPLVWIDCEYVIYSKAE